MTNTSVYAYNPFAFSTAEDAWEDKKNLLPVRIYKGAVGAVYDICVKNPYDLTIGNCKKLINAENPQSTRTKVIVSATAAFAVLYTLMFYGMVFHLSGKCLQVLGSKTGYAAISRVGEASKTFGKNMFVAGAVPIYGLFYAVPKRIILAMPEITRFVVTKIAIAAKWIFQEVLAPLWRKVLFPAAQIIYKGLKFVVKKIEPVLKEICHLVASTAKWVFQHVLIPFWKKALLPLLKTIHNAARLILTEISSVLNAIVLKISRVISWTFQQIIVPAWDNYVLPALRIIGPIIDSVVRTVGQTIQTLLQETVRVASFIFQAFIAPIFNGLAHFLLTVGTFLGDYVIKPFGSVLADLMGKVGDVFKYILNGAIIPAVKTISGSFNALSESVLDFKREIGQAINSIWNGLFSSKSW